MEESKRKEAIEKLLKKLPESFVDDVKIADEKTLRDKIINLTKEVEDIDDKKKNDSTLNHLKEQVKDLNGGYKDARKERTDRVKFILFALEERGKL